MTIHPFLARLEQGPILGDGAMGTELYARGILPSQCYDAVNITDPDLVQRVHMDYLAAGAEIIETNTFGANGSKLAAYGRESQVRDINRRGGRIARYARDIAGSTAFVEDRSVRWEARWPRWVRSALTRLTRSIASKWLV